MYLTQEQAIRFVVAWTTSTYPTEVAIKVGLKVAVVVQVADQLRALGVWLKPMPAPPPPRPPKWRRIPVEKTAEVRVKKLSSLSSPEQQFFASHIKDAITYGESLARQLGPAGAVAAARGLVATAMTDLLARLTDEFTDLDRASAKVKSWAFNTVRAVVQRLHRQGFELELPAAPSGRPVDVADPSSLPVADAAAEQESERAATDAQLHKLRALLGGPVPTTHGEWMALGLRLGMTRKVVCAASKGRLPALVTDELRERMAGKNRFTFEAPARPGKVFRLVNRLRAAGAHPKLRTARRRSRFDLGALAPSSN